ncbi:MAG: hypothetical protein JSV19_04470 [Phycisphaerales bacterium]|nr:MAG: hypothetical protein JSV19_04470 [Phycisphaerales bacterium]
MAKQAVGPIERHVEKGVLGICGLLLLAVIARYLGSSPNRTQIGAESVGPDTVHTALAEEAERLRQAVAREQPTPSSERNPVPKLREWMNDFYAAAGFLDPELRPRPLPPLPAVPDVGEKARAPGDKIELARFLPPESVKAEVAGRTVARVEPPVILLEASGVGDTFGDEYEMSFNWVTVSSIYNRNEQERLFREAGYHPGRREHYVLGADLQRRERNWDGSYSEWQDITTYAPVKPPAPPQVIVMQTGLTPTVPIETREDVGYYAEAVRDPLNQLDLMRPLFPVPEAGDSWKLPEYEGIDIQELDDEYFEAADEVGSMRGQDRYADLIEETPDADSEEDKIDQAIDDMRRRVKRGFVAVEEAEQARSELESLQTQASPGLSRSQSQALEELLNQIDAAIERLRRPRGGGSGEAGQQAPPRPTAPVQVVWAHDLLGDSVVSGKTYQYRMRLRLYNRYCAYPPALKNPADAEKVVVLTEWSEPTQDVTIEQDTEFFLASLTRDTVKAEIFKWVRGDWVKQSFPLEVGKPITGSKRMQLPSDPDGMRQLVDFDTGAMVLYIDFDRSYRPVRKAPGGGMSLQPSKSTVAVVYADSKGRLQERLLAVDKDSDVRKEFQKKARRRPKVPKERPPTAPPEGPPRKPPLGPPGGGRGGGGGPPL